MKDSKAHTCCFTGHRKISTNKFLEISIRVKYEIEQLINNEVIYFGAGGALGFDTIAALAVLELKEIYPFIKLILVLPCVNQTKSWDKKSTELYVKIMNGADKITYISKEYTPNCMLRRNRHLVEHSSHCICYYDGSSGGTAYTVAYAKEKGLKIVNCIN